MASVGVYITYFNEGELLPELIQSLVSQGWPDEIIVYDDCSSRPAQEFLSATPMVRVVRGDKNCGPAVGRNRLLQLAKADYVHFHDSDDFFLPGWLNRVRATLESCSPDVVFTEVVPYKNGERLGWCLGLDTLNRDPDLLAFCIQNSMLVPAGTFKRTLLLEIGGYPESLWQSEDYAFHIRLACRNPRYVVISDGLVGIRQRFNSRSSNAAEVYRDGLEGLKLVQAEVPVSHHHLLADAAISMSRKLYHVGDLRAARVGFSWAVALGGARYLKEHWGYRLCAKAVGPFCAEKLSSTYRMLPEWLRQVLRR
jgi:glycosyltransferase involved in cell wall biosynthesis